MTFLVGFNVFSLVSLRFLSVCVVVLQNFGACGGPRGVQSYRSLSTKAHFPPYNAILFELRTKERYRYVHLCTALPGHPCGEARGSEPRDPQKVIHVVTAAAIEALATVDIGAERTRPPAQRCARGCARAGFGPTPPPATR